MVDDVEFREEVFDLLNGNINLKEYPVVESEYVKSEFFAGSYCAGAYENMLAAYSRICQRLNVEEWDDPDVECIIDMLMDIGKYLALKMFEYGVFFARQEEKKGIE